MRFLNVKGHGARIPRGVVCALFLVWSCILLFPIAEGFLFGIFATILAVAGVIDLERRWVPGTLCLLLGAIGVAEIYFFVQNPVSHLLGASVISILFLLVKFLFRTGFGGGDVKLIAASSLFLGWMPLLRGVFAGCLLAGCAGILRWIVQKRIFNCEMAFVPFLAIGFLSVVFYGDF